jgi:hypothetical protein
VEVDVAGMGDPGWRSYDFMPPLTAQLFYTAQSHYHNMEADREATNLGPEISDEIPREEVITPKEPKRRFVGRKTAAEKAAANASEVNIEDSGKAIQRKRSFSARYPGCNIRY